MKKIGIISEPFGFGPSSKAYAILKRLQKNIDARYYIMSKSIVKEYFEKENIELYDFSFDYDYDLIINVLAPQYVKYFIKKNIPVVYIDSLGFLWDKSFFKKFRYLNYVDAYFVQDVFDSYNHLANIVQNKEILKKVGAIVDLDSIDEECVFGNEFVVQIGGLSNPLNINAARDYLNLIQPILQNIGEKKLIILASSVAKQFLNKKFNVETAQHKKAMSYYKNSKKVLTSTGLTTLLELGGIDKKFSPLPPQNLSQLKILQNLFHYSVTKPSSLEYLLSFYSKKHFINEEEGVKYVNTVNKYLTDNNILSDDYCADILKVEIQLENVPSFKGSDECVCFIQNLLDG